ncbi:DUF2231 domain-containing protein [Luteimicrobium sp. DT211]|uniref:DUF2231 domain-containing protein n=1 Tax=Luteimicrobium sp. DT211 TaxID=3393412 RepID=UPI003CFAD15E
MSATTSSPTEASALHRAVDGVGRSRPVEALTPLYDTLARLLPHGAVDAVLRGKPFGHPLHPTLSDLPIGLWTSAVLLDAGGRRFEDASRRLVGAGLVAAVPTALAGLADWRTTHQPARGVGVAHAALNGGAVLCFAASWLARRRGRGKALSLLGAGLVSAGGYLGGHLVLTLHAPDEA